MRRPTDDNITLLSMGRHDGLPVCHHMIIYVGFKSKSQFILQFYRSTYVFVTDLVLQHQSFIMMKILLLLMLLHVML